MLFVSLSSVIQMAIKRIIDISYKTFICLLKNTVQVWRQVKLALDLCNVIDLIDMFSPYTFSTFFSLARPV